MIALAGWRIRARSRFVALRALSDRLREQDGELMRLQADAIAGYEVTTQQLVDRARRAEQDRAELEAEVAQARMETRVAQAALPSSDRQIRIAEFARALAEADEAVDTGRDPDPEVDALWRAMEPARYLLLEHPK